MSRSKPWFKAWAEWQHNPDFLRLTLSEQGAWWRLYTLAHECDDDGRIVDASGDPLDHQSMIDVMHISTVQDIRTFNMMETKMTKAGYLHHDDGALVVTNYHEEQSVAPSETKAAVRERVRALRKRRAEQDTKVPPAPLPKRDEEQEGEEEQECNGDVTAKRSLHVTENQLQLASHEGLVDHNGARDFVGETARVTRELRANRADNDVIVTDQPLPEWLDMTAWNGYLEMRKKKRAVPTQEAVRLALKKLSELKDQGQDPTEILNQSILNNWTGIFALKGDSYGSVRRHTKANGAHTDEDYQRSVDKFKRGGSVPAVP